MDARSLTLSRSARDGREPRVLCLGLVASDFLVRTAFPVPRDLKIRARRLVRDGGGPAANAAVGLARLGAKSAFAGAVGGDEIGRSQIAELAAEGVDTGGMRARDGVASLVAFILIDESDGARTIFSAPAERPLLEPGSAELPAPRPDLVLMDGWAGPAGVELARAARNEGIPTLLDAGSLRPEIVEVLPQAEVAIVSRDFAEEFAGSGRVEEALPSLLAHGPRLAAVTLGAEGVIAGARGAEETFHVPAFDGPIVDTTGAGDAFHAGAAWALASGRGWEESLRVGAAVAVLKCRRPGARRGLPTREELERFLDGLTEQP